MMFQQFLGNRHQVTYHGHRLQNELDFRVHDSITNGSKFYIIKKHLFFLFVNINIAIKKIYLYF
jgi:hypothetical protein